MIKKYNCSFCGKEYDVEFYKNGKPKIVFCSEECREQYNKENIRKSKCRYCGKEFVIERYMSGKWDRRKYCCTDCETKDREQNKATEKIIKCLNCGKDMIVQRSSCDRKFNSKRRFCSDACAKEYRKSVPVSEGICRVCGKRFKQTFLPEFNRYTQYDCCSDECRKIHSSNGETKTIVCENCGKQFTVGRGSDGGFLKRKLCDDCLNHKEQYKMITCQRCGEQFEVKRRQTGNGFVQRKLCDKCLEQHYKEHNIISKINQHFSDRLTELGIFNSLEFALGDYYYDIYIPNKLTFIEINPNYIHTTIGNHWNGFGYSAKFEDYHAKKTKYAIEQGYRCINVWDWDNEDKILNLLRNREKLYARKMILRPVSKDKANKFLDIYHLQNRCNGNIVNLGLFNEFGNLTQLMTFGKPRYNKNYEWELLRLCTHADYKVVGGAERLFKHFCTEYKPKSVISYCDISKFMGDVYHRLGFKLKIVTKPQKVWSKGLNYITDNLLRMRGFDQLFNTNHGKGTSNEELMLQANWLPVYDCGQMVFTIE